MRGRTIIVAADTGPSCPKCGHGFPLSDGISRQAIERHAEEHDRALAAEAKRVEAKARASAVDAISRREVQLKAQIESAQREAADLKPKLEQGSQQTQGEALDQLLRGGRFVDLHAVVREGFRIGVEGYGVKELELLRAFGRKLTFRKRPVRAATSCL